MCNMKCDECMNKISLYIDQMLDEEEEKVIVAHLDLCETCHKEYELLVRMIDLLKPNEETYLPKTFHRDLIKRLKQEQKVKPIKNKRFKWEYPAGVVAAFLVGFIVLNHSLIGNKNNSTTQAPMLANSIAQDQTEQMTEATLEKEDVKQGKMLEAPSATMNKMNEAVEAQTVEGKINDTIVEQTIWEVTITESSSFIEHLKGYLDEQKLTYQEEESSLMITTEADGESLWGWLQAQSEVKNVSVIQSKGGHLKLIYHQ